MEYAVNTLSGLRCQTVHAHVGDRVTTETLLFEIDMADLEEQIREQEMNIKKLSLTIQEQEQNSSLAANEKKTDQDRAREDYDRAAETAKSNVDRAKEDLRGARDALESLRQNPAGVTSEEDRKKAQAEYEAWTAKEQELQKALTEAQAEKQSAEEDLKKLEEAQEPDVDTDAQKLEEAQKRAEAAEKAYQEARSAYEAHTANPISKPDYSQEDAEKAAWEEKESALENSIGAAEQSLDDARKTRDDTSWKPNATWTIPKRPPPQTTAFPSTAWSSPSSKKSWKNTRKFFTQEEPSTPNPTGLLPASR